ncbi:MAG: AarF/UbiB family protein, partial [Acidobacteriota bacterium]
QTTTRDELVEYILQQVGPQRIEQYRIEFADEVLAEASIGAVIRSRLTLPGEDAPRQAVCKVIKSYALPALNQDLEIMDGLTLYFEENAGFYGIGDVPLAEMFQEVREALSREVMVSQEQRNLARAAEYYREDPKVKIPEVYPASTENVTFMEFIEGGKITDAFPGNRKARRHMARRLADILSVDVLFSSRDEALFHGDPHAGNVFYTSSDPSNPYRIALLDWGLAGVLGKQQRVQLIQLLLGVYLRDRGRLRRNLGALIESGQPLNAEGQRRADALVAETLAASRGKQAFDVLSNLITRLAQAGYRINFDLALYIKSQITIIGILKELDPDLKMTERVTRHVGRQVLKEMPKRLGNMVYFPNWKSRNYPSLVSNDDVFDVQATLIKRGFKKLGGWMWKGIRAPFR